MPLVCQEKTECIRKEIQYFLWRYVKSPSLLLRDKEIVAISSPFTAVAAGSDLCECRRATEQHFGRSRERERRLERARQVLRFSWETDYMHNCVGVKSDLLSIIGSKLYTYFWYDMEVCALSHCPGVS
jgi:hypothetical protein